MNILVVISFFTTTIITVAETCYFPGKKRIKYLSPPEKNSSRFKDRPTANILDLNLSNKILNAKDIKLLAALVDSLSVKTRLKFSKVENIKVLSKILEKYVESKNEVEEIVLISDKRRLLSVRESYKIFYLVTKILKVNSCDGEYGKRLDNQPLYLAFDSNEELFFVSLDVYGVYMSSMTDTLAAIGLKKHYFSSSKWKKLRQLRIDLTTESNIVKLLLLLYSSNLGKEIKRLKVSPVQVKNWKNLALMYLFNKNLGVMKKIVSVEYPFNLEGHILISILPYHQPYRNKRPRYEVSLPIPLPWKNGGPPYKTVQHLKQTVNTYTKRFDHLARLKESNVTCVNNTSSLSFLKQMPIEEKGAF
eukprot:snap_masked-scaffold_11-processed-gene-10.31-mRNA-1 protein AED:1.00 eAED:1.00 QI:0/0/0/0/1/1/2/0/360